MGVTSGWFTRTRRIGAVAMGVLTTLVACRDDVTPGRVTGLDERASLVSNAPNQQDWRHCENEKDPASACNWITGNLNETQNLYYEGWYVPHALRIPHIVGDAPDTLVMTFGFKKGGHHTFDFLGAWNASLPNANVCTESSYSEFCTGPVSATTPPAMRPISASTPAGSLAAALVTAASACGTARGDSLAAIISRAEAGGPAIALQGIDLAAITVAGASLDRCNTDEEMTVTLIVTPKPGVTSALLLIGAHIARTRDWMGGGATMVPGSPYHLGLVSINDITTGSMDLQMQSNAIEPMGRVMLIKRTEGAVGSFSFTRVDGDAPNPIPATFTMSTGTPGSASSGLDTLLYEDVPLGTQVITETAPPAGWALTALTCVDPSDNSPVDLAARAATIVVDDSELIVCTFTNTAAGAIRVMKTAVGGDSTFSFTPTGFGSGAFALTTVSGTAETTFAGIAPAVADSGTYRLSESALAGWAAGSWACVRQDSTTSAGNPATGITVVLGETTTCAITNTKQATIVVQKVMLGGTDTFSFTEDITGSISADSGILSATVAPGTYHATETALAGWDLTALSCDDAGSSGDVATRRATFVVAAGETVTCTFTNTKRGAIRVMKTAVGGDSTFSFTPTGFGSGAFALTTVSGTADTTFGGLVPSPADSGTYRLSESALAGWTSGTLVCVRQDGTTSAGDPDTGITVAAGETTTCAITNTKWGMLVVKKVMVGGTGSFGFTGAVTGTIATNNGTLMQAVAPGTYQVTEDSLAGWYLTGLSCDATASSGDLALRRATYVVAAGETVTCTFTNTLVMGGPTRTLGFWSQHQDLVQAFIFGPTGTPPAGYTLAIPVSVLLPASVTQCADPANRFWMSDYYLGGLNANVARTSTEGRRSALDQARMQLMRQLLAAVLNSVAFGSIPEGPGAYATAFAAYCGTDRGAILMAANALAQFNEAGDSLPWMIGPQGPARNKIVTSGMIALWDALP
jgi:hypothetical protein